MYENTKPILCKKIRYYKDKAFKERLLPPSEIPLLDLDTYRAKVEGRVRNMTEDDIINGLDHQKIAIDIHSLPELSKDPTSEEVDEFVNEYFKYLNSFQKANYPSKPKKKKTKKTRKKSTLQGMQMTMDESIELGVEKEHSC